jgi:hypothetical protein
MSKESSKKMRDESYEEYARKMDLLENGPTTTNFEQLLGMDIQLPEPSSIPDDEMRTKLFEVLAGLQRLGVFLNHTDHLSDRELYAKLWNEILCEEVPALDGFGSNIVTVLHPGDPVDDRIYLKYFADEEWRAHWVNDYPEYDMPPQEEPPFDRDRLLPNPIEGLPEAEGWLRANWSRSAFATNRFGTTDAALKFVEQLYAAGATEIGVDNIRMLACDNWTPYADTLIVRLPEDPARRRKLFDLMEDVGQPDEGGGEPVEELLMDHGQACVRLWWD